MSTSEITPTSYKAEFSDDGGKSFASSALRFATEEEAKSYMYDLSMRWLAATDWHVSPSDDPVNYRWEDGRAVRIDA